jgi:hypothetical protein
MTKSKLTLSILSYRNRMNVRNLLLAGAMAALVFPAAAFAQDDSMRAQFEQARTQAKTAAFNDLSADHRAKVQAIIDRVQSGSLDPRDAGSQIDAILTPAESQAVLGEAQKLRDAMRQLFAAQGGGGFSGQRPGGEAGAHRGGMNRKPDAGRFLLMVSRQPGEGQGP